ncbi:MAG: glutaredoxin family protein [Patescibacteria group bacterium]
MKEVTIYSTPTCVYCEMAKEFFREKEVGFTDHDVSRDTEKRQEMVEKSGQMGVPVIFIGEDMVIGFDRDKVEELLENS